MKPGDPLTPRHRARNTVMGLVLGGLALLFFAITIAKLAMA